MIRFFLRAISLLVPYPVRPRWREEWTAEMNHARSQGRRLRTRMRMAAGSEVHARRQTRTAHPCGAEFLAGALHKRIEVAGAKNLVRRR